MSPRQIELRGVEVHNLKKIDLDLPHRQLICICGVSGSGKTSLALDTLYAEGQRRYIESFSAYTRQFLEKLEKPQAERISGLPPAIAVDRRTSSSSNRSTIGTATEISDYLRLLFARVGAAYCQACQRPVPRLTAPAIAEALRSFPPATQLMVGFEFQPDEGQDSFAALAELRERGFVRVIAGDAVFNLGETLPTTAVAPPPWLIVVDRLTTDMEDRRVRESVEQSLSGGKGICCVLANQAGTTEFLQQSFAGTIPLQGKTWQRYAFSSRNVCPGCRTEYPELEPLQFSFNSPLGACPTCEGTGTAIDWDWDLLTDPRKTIQDGGLLPWVSSETSRDRGQIERELVAAGISVGIPLETFSVSEIALAMDGSPNGSFIGLRAWLTRWEAEKMKGLPRGFFQRFRAPRACRSCLGTRLRPEPLAFQVGGATIAGICNLRIDAAAEFFAELQLAGEDQQIARVILAQLRARLGYLQQVGLGYLTLDRILHTLSGGEAQRVSLTSALGSSLVNMLYVLDEPSVGLHPRDVERLITAINGLRDRGNSVVLVEHEEAFLRAADLLVEIGPGAGNRGGKVVFQGKLAELLTCRESATGDFLAGRRGVSAPQRRPTNRGWIRLVGARGNNLKNVSVEFPLGVLCLVTGVSGAGKSSLVQDTLHGALCRRKRLECEKPLPYDDVVGDGQIDAIVMVDQEPIGRSPRSNPVTYIKAFDPIRAVFAETVEARTRNYTAGHFSFNVEGGRCTHCEGEGYVRIDMQFLADVFMKCPQCHGTRYRKEILAVTHRGKNIAEVLEMSVQEAFLFFRGQPKVQGRLKPLLDVGLEYLRLGQPANTLSAGESQRLKLATYLAEVTRSRTLFLLDEPTTGLHFADIVRLIDCFDALVNVGHSVLIVDHNLQLMSAADYLIDLGPGAGEDGGRVVVQGTPEQVAACPESQTGRYLREILARIEEANARLPEDEAAVSDDTEEATDE